MKPYSLKVSGLFGENLLEITFSILDKIHIKSMVCLDNMG